MIKTAYKNKSLLLNAFVHNLNTRYEGYKKCAVEIVKLIY